MQLDLTQSTLKRLLLQENQVFYFSLGRME